MGLYNLWCPISKNLFESQLLANKDPQRGAKIPWNLAFWQRTGEIIIYITVFQRTSHLILHYNENMLWQNPALALLSLPVMVPKTYSELPTRPLVPSAERAQLLSPWRVLEAHGLRQHGAGRWESQILASGNCESSLESLAPEMGMLQKCWLIWKDWSFRSNGFYAIDWDSRAIISCYWEWCPAAFALVMIFQVTNSKLKLA